MLNVAADGPIRVLYFDAEGAEQLKPGILRKAMEQLGRDAIYFDSAVQHSYRRVGKRPCEAVTVTLP